MCNIQLTKSISFCVGEFWSFRPTGVEDLLFVCPILGRGDTLLNSPLVPECFWGAGSFETCEWSAVFWFVLLLLLVLLLVFWVVSWYKIVGNIHFKKVASFWIVYLCVRGQSHAKIFFLILGVSKLQMICFTWSFFCFYITSTPSILVTNYKNTNLKQTIIKNVLSSEK
jgi:hypothetical protein